MNSTILTIIGPTAVGKTAISIELAKKLDGEIIGLDSRQIYFNMEIGTAQPTIEERSGIRHHLIGVRAPDKVIAAGEYAKLIVPVIIDIKQRGKLPVICGGAGLYYRALREGIFEGSISDLEVRLKLESEYDSNPQKLFDKLTKIDSVYAKIVHINNKKRLVRALEIFELTGKIPTEHFAEQKINQTSKLDLFSVLLSMDRKFLYKRICKRTEQMLDHGLIDEVKSLLSNYNEDNVHPLDSIGYKQVRANLNNKLNYDDMVEEINIRTRQYAKKQFTWFRSEPISYEIEINETSQINEIVEKVISNYKSEY
jgi:tRNA dimethylallyltransferase